jgi:ubiquinol-cytochrome c reductase cytochrome b subunit
MILYLLPFSSSLGKLTPRSFTPPYQVMFWVLVVLFLILTWLGACPIEEPYATLAIPISILYFMSFFVLVSLPAIWKKC